MNKRFSARFAVLLATVILLTSMVTTKASAAGQTFSAWMPSVTTTGSKLAMSWGAVSGAAYYQVRVTNSPNTTLANSYLYTTTSGTTLSSAMNGSLGYRYFRVYAYNASGTLLGYTNLVGIAKYPSGLVVRMKQDWNLTSSYPDPNGVYAPNLYQRPTWFVTIDSTVLASYVAPNFKMSEFILQPGITSAVVDPLMVQHVQNARWRYGVMWIESGYRTPAYNASIGASKYSRHLYGDAVDVRASSYDQYTALNSVFAAENPSYVESWAEAGMHHWHGDWRYDNKGYTNW
ncbi:MAG TPA: D-Ala-D-Ala carboxypeptidase family metallohydrolase [Symbiobacteriaceae bacterium]|nr:D-Ala-D-Ala carboxypeptidase family metallohydrolase [Symbiobacteriaceae bacterium]